MDENNGTISLSDFLKLDLRVGEIVAASSLSWSEKLLELTIDFGPLGKKSVLSGIRPWYEPEELIGVQAIFIVNLPTKTVKDKISEAMILASENKKGDVVLISPRRKLPNGAKVH